MIYIPRVFVDVEFSPIESPETVLYNTRPMQFYLYNCKYAILFLRNTNNISFTKQQVQSRRNGFFRARQQYLTNSKPKLRDIMITVAHFQENFARLTLWQIWCKSTYGGRRWDWWKCNDFLVYLFFRNLPTCQIVQTTRNRAKTSVLFGVPLTSILLPILGGG